MRGFAFSDRRPAFFLALFFLLLPWMWWSPLPLNGQWVDIAFILLLAASWKQVFPSPGFCSLDGLVLAYFLCLIPSIAFGAYTPAALISWGKLGYCISLYFALGTLFKQDALRAEAAGWFAKAIVLAVVLSIVGFALSLAILGGPGEFGLAMRVPGFGKTLRLSGGVTPAMFGNLLTMAVPFVLGARMNLSKRRPVWGTAGVFLVFLAELLTFSQSWAGFAAASLLFTWPSLGTRRSKWIRILAVPCLVALALAIQAASTVYIHRVDVQHDTAAVDKSDFPVHVLESDKWPVAHISVTYQMIHYAVAKAFAWQTFWAHPLFGVGVGNFRGLFEQARASGTGQLSEVVGIGEPNCTLLGYLAETGLVGALGLLALWGGAFLLGTRLLSTGHARGDAWIVRAALAGLGGLWLNGINVDLMHFRFLWIGLAFLRGAMLARSSRR